MILVEMDEVMLLSATSTHLASSGCSDEHTEFYNEAAPGVQQQNSESVYKSLHVLGPKNPDWTGVEANIGPNIILQIASTAAPTGCARFARDVALNPM